MSIQSQTFTSNGTFSLPSNLISSSISIVVYGAPGDASLNAGNAGAAVSGTMLATLLPFDAVIGQNGFGAQGGNGYSGGGGGGGWQYGNSPSTALFFGGGGGGSSAVISPTGALYVEAGGGDGGSYTFGPGTAAPSLYPGGSGGGYASNTPDNGTNVGLGAGSGGSQGGSGGAGNGPGDPFFGGGTGHGGGSPTNGISASGQLSGTGVGSGGDIQLGCAASFADSSNVAGVTYSEISTVSGSVVFSWHAADAPNAPALVSPKFQDVDSFDEGVTFVGVYGAPSADTGALSSVALSLQVGGTGTIHYWNGTDFSSTSPVWTVPTTGQGVTNNEEFTIAIPPGIISDSQTYNWAMATAESIYGLQGPFSTAETFVAVTAPTVVITAPSGDVNSLTPTVTWTSSFSGGGHQLNYRFVIYSVVQDMPFGTNPPTPSTLIYDSGLVPGVSTSFNIPSGILDSINNYYGYLQIQSSAGSIASLWTPAFFTVQLMSSDTVTLTGFPETEPVTGLPATRLTMTTSGTDLNEAWFQADYVGDGSWTDCICGIQTVTSKTCVMYDLGVPYNIPAAYRVRGVGYIGEQQYVTSWSNTVNISEIPSSYWAIVAPTNLDGSMQFYRLPSSGAGATTGVASPTTPAMPGSMVASLIIDEWEQLGTFRPFGKSTATMVHGDIWNPEFDLDCFFSSPAQWTTFRAVRGLQQVVLMKSDMEGSYYWVTLGPDLNPGIMSEADRQSDPKRGLTIHCTPTDHYVPPNPFVPTN